MRKLMLLGALAALGWAGQGLAQSTREETREAGQAAERDAKQAGERAKEWSGEQKNKAEESAKRADDRTDDAQVGATGSGSGDAARQTSQPGATSQGMASRNDERKHPLFEGKDNFDVEGKVSKASASSLTLMREDLPPATLTIDRNTRIEVDGQRASASMLKPGQDVKASFNLQGSKPMAVEVKAEKLDSQR